MGGSLPSSIEAILARPEWRYFPYAPSQKQLALLLSPSFETFYGGAAGPGKSSGLLMAALLYADTPGYNAAIFRKTYPELYGSSGLIARSKDWLLGKGPEWSEQHKRWTFPGGGTLVFGYCEHDDDARAYQGHEWTFLGVDELTTWNRWPFDFLRSRVRRSKALDVPLRIVATANPGGIGHGWVKARYIDPLTRNTDTTTIRGTISDNPGLDPVEYAKTLEMLSPVLKAQLMSGDWNVAEEGSLIERQYLPVVDALPHPNHLRVVRFWDRAATKDAGCYTVGVRMSMDLQRKVYVEHVVRGQWDAGNVDQVMLATAKTDGRHVAVDWEQEPGSAGISVTAHLRKMLAGWAVFGTPATGPKWIRAQPFASYARCGNLSLARGGWNEAYIDELVMATPDMKGLVDQVDATSGAFAWLTTNSTGSLMMTRSMERPAPQVEMVPGMSLESPW